MTTLLYDATVFTNQGILEDCAVTIQEDGTIGYVGKVENAPQVDGRRISLRGRILAPGFIDVHVHGGNGITFIDDELGSGLETYSKWVTCNGVTGFLASIAGPNPQTLIDMIHNYVEIMEQGVSGAELLGLHLEGPFINREKKGAFNPAWIRGASVDEMSRYLEAGNGKILQVTLAPEMPEGQEVARLLRQNGVVAAMGHTNTDYETASKALKGNFNHVTHTFNAQSSFDHRAPGVFGAVLTSDHITAELIGDGVHVHPGAMKVLIRCLGTDRVVLITDAMTGAGLPDGTYNLVGNDVTVKDGRATLANGTLAGSVTTLDRCVANTHLLAGFSLDEAVKMASLNPARAMGLADRLGSIQPGKDASLTVLDEDVNIYLTMVKGRIVYNNL